MTGQDHELLSFDIIKETLRATNLGQLQEGGEVNFERQAMMIVMSCAAVRCAVALWRVSSIHAVVKHSWLSSCSAEQCG